MANSDEALVVKLMQSFWNAMNQWEQDTYTAYSNAINNNINTEEVRKSAKEALIKIYDEFLTKKERKTGRLAGPDAAAFPEYDIAREEILNIENISNGKYLVTTKRRDPNILDYYTEQRYKIVKSEGTLRIDSQENFSSHKGKWIRRSL